MTNEELNETIRLIRRQLVRSMNGVAAQQMREAGIRYEKNYGVELVRLCRMAETLPRDELLAQALWRLHIRETMMLAVLICPLSAFERIDVREWIAQIPAYELAEMASRKLFARLPNATELANDLLNGKDFEPACGWLMLSSLLAQTADQESLKIKNLALAELSKTELLPALMLFFKRFAQEKTHLCNDLLATLAEVKSTNVQLQFLYEEVKTQLEFS